MGDAERRSRQIIKNVASAAERSLRVLRQTAQTAQTAQSSLLGYGQTGSQHIKGNHNIYVRLTRHSAGEMVETNH